MPSTHHPCGALPVRGWSLSVWRCDHHQAFWATAYGYEQTTGDDPEITRPVARVEFGPFDTMTDVQRWIRHQWTAWLATLD